jgi:hypothetical protein
MAIALPNPLFAPVMSTRFRGNLCSSFIGYSRGGCYHCAAALVSGSSLKVSLSILPVNLNGES